MRYLLLLLLIACSSPHDHRTYFSQWSQDKYVNQRFFKDKKGGFFVDIGASDGITGSNSLFFEKELGWNGICIEPIPEIFAELERRRECISVNCAIAEQEGTSSFLFVKDLPALSGLIAEYDPQHMQRIERELAEIDGECCTIEVPCIRFNALMEEHSVAHIDFLSIDTEGNELKILQSIDFDRFTIDVITVENNYNDPEIPRLLKSKGFKRIARLNCDEVYKRKR